LIAQKTHDASCPSKYGRATFADHRGDKKEKKRRSGNPIFFSVSKID